MALTTPNFSASQTIGLPDEINLTDTSVGSDVLIVTRHVYIQDANGDYLVETGTTTDYEVWDYADSSITLDVLTQDTACDITVNWLSVSGVVLYTKTILFDFTLNIDQYLLNLSLAQISSNINAAGLSYNKSFYYNKMKLYVCKLDADNAVQIGSNIAGSQAALNRGKYLIDNPNLFY